MGAQHEYFVADKAELALLDLGRSPVTQLPPELAAELPGVDPTVVLLSLVEVLTATDFDTLLGEAASELVYDGGDAGPWVVAVERSAVVAIQGADGDPELEWEDTVDQWDELVAEELGESRRGSAPGDHRRAAPRSAARSPATAGSTAGPSEHVTPLIWATSSRL